jgi:hypothetical protein
MQNPTARTSLLVNVVAAPHWSPQEQHRSPRRHRPVRHLVLRDDLLGRRRRTTITIIVVLRTTVIIVTTCTIVLSQRAQHLDINSTTCLQAALATTMPSTQCQQATSSRTGATVPSARRRRCCHRRRRPASLPTRFWPCVFLCPIASGMIVVVIATRHRPRVPSCNMPRPGVGGSAWPVPRRGRRWRAGAVGGGPFGRCPR